MYIVAYLSCASPPQGISTPINGVLCTRGLAPFYLLEALGLASPADSRHILTPWSPQGRPTPASGVSSSGIPATTRFDADPSVVLCDLDDGFTEERVRQLQALLQAQAARSEPLSNTINQMSKAVTKELEAVSERMGSIQAEFEQRIKLLDERCMSTSPLRKAPRGTDMDEDTQPLPDAGPSNRPAASSFATRPPTAPRRTSSATRFSVAPVMRGRAADLGDRTESSSFPSCPLLGRPGIGGRLSSWTSPATCRTRGACAFSTSRSRDGDLR